MWSGQRARKYCLRISTTYCLKPPEKSILPRGGFGSIFGQYLVVRYLGDPAIQNINQILPPIYQQNGPKTVCKVKKTFSENHNRLMIICKTAIWQKKSQPKLDPLSILPEGDQTSVPSVLARPLGLSSVVPTQRFVPSPNY